MELDVQVGLQQQCPDDQSAERVTPLYQTATTYINRPYSRQRPNFVGHHFGRFAKVKMPQQA